MVLMDPDKHLKGELGERCCTEYPRRGGNVPSVSVGKTFVDMLSRPVFQDCEAEHLANPVPIVAVH